jgi:hypothetical protein
VKHHKLSTCDPIPILHDRDEIDSRRKRRNVKPTFFSLPPGGGKLARLLAGVGDGGWTAIVLIRHRREGEAGLSVFFYKYWTPVE